MSKQQELSSDDELCPQDQKAAARAALGHSSFGVKQPRQEFIPQWNEESLSNEELDEECNELLSDLCTFGQPDLAQYLGQFALTPMQKVKMCRSYASFLCTQEVHLNRNVSAKKQKTTNVLRRSNAMMSREELE